MFVGHFHQRRVPLTAGALLLSLSFCGCATSKGSSLMNARAGMPARAKPGTYLPVEDLPWPRKNPAMTAEERSRLQGELMAARDRQSAAAKAQGGPIADPIKP
ncbi:hypothetical protein [Bradyrhizobium sp. 33ap4]|uniref:hypothetical protein n=1 Tax=Bradyrhizobium sp. 33ap4 TaxID=3061630 RepID=UPI00292DF9A5|nr:hypothetical protein [Bradyrhizobium sp. 33ap4]